LKNNKDSDKIYTIGDERIILKSQVLCSVFMLSPILNDIFNGYKGGPEGILNSHKLIMNNSNMRVIHIHSIEQFNYLFTISHSKIGKVLLYIEPTYQMALKVNFKLHSGEAIEYIINKEKRIV